MAKSNATLSRNPNDKNSQWLVNPLRHLLSWRDRNSHACDKVIGWLFNPAFKNRQMLINKQILIIECCRNRENLKLSDSHMHVMSTRELCKSQPIIRKLINQLPIAERVSTSKFLIYYVWCCIWIYRDNIVPLQKRGNMSHFKPETYQREACE